MGTLASAFHAKATTGTVRAQLITVRARITCGARRLTLHLPQNWLWQDAWQHLFAHPARPTAQLTPQPTRPKGPETVGMWKSWADQRLPHAFD